MPVLRYYIPSRNRPTTQITYAQLEYAGLCPIVVLSADETHDYSAYRHVRSTATNLSKKREWICKYAGDAKFAMIDDDIEIRENYVDGSFDTANGASLRRMDTYVGRLLNYYPHGAAARQYMLGPMIKGGAWPYAPNRGRYGQVLFFNPKTWLKVPLFYVGTTVTRNDMCCQFSLMRRGLPFFRLTKWSQNDVRPKGWKDTGMGDTRSRIPKEEHLIHTHFGMWKYMTANKRINMRKICADWGIPPWLGTKPPPDLPIRYLPY